MLWRRFNDIEDLVGIVRLLEVKKEDSVGSYSHPFYGKKYPIVCQTLEQFLQTDEWKNETCNEAKTYRLSNYVYNNIDSQYSVKSKFSLVKDAYYYFDRRDKYV